MTLTLLSICYRKRKLNRKISFHFPSNKENSRIEDQYALLIKMYSTFVLHNKNTCLPYFFRNYQYINFLTSIRQTLMSCNLYPWKGENLSFFLASEEDTQSETWESPLAPAFTIHIMSLVGVSSIWLKRYHIFIIYLHLHWPHFKPSSNP